MKYRWRGRGRVPNASPKGRRKKPKTYAIGIAIKKGA